MTEYELLALLREYDSPVAQDFEFFITATFAVIVVSYVTEGKLNKTARYVIAALYTSTVLLLALRYFNLQREMLVIFSSLAELDSDFLRDSGSIPFAAILRIFVMVCGSVVTIYVLFRPGAISNKTDLAVRDDDP